MTPNVLAGSPRVLNHCYVRVATVELQFSTATVTIKACLIAKCSRPIMSEEQMATLMLLFQTEATVEERPNTCTDRQPPHTTHTRTHARTHARSRHDHAAALCGLSDRPLFKFPDSNICRRETGSTSIFDDGHRRIVSQLPISLDFPLALCFLMCYSVSVSV